MNRRLIAIGIILTAGGCGERSETTSTALVRETPGKDPDAGLDRIIQDISGAPDSPSEAAALSRLHDWLTDHRMMYHVMVENAETHSPAPAAAGSVYRLRTMVEIYQGDRPYRTFQFVPRDNRNLTALGLN